MQKIEDATGIEHDMIFPLIQATELYQLEQALILDCRFNLNDPFAGFHAYCEGHLPDAHYLDLDQDLSGVRTGTNGRHPLPNKAQLANKLARFGLQQDQRVVVYDAQDGMYAARAWWLLRWLGHQTVQVLDGGLHAWVEVGLPLSTEQPICVPSDFKSLSIDGMVTVNGQMLLSQLLNPVWQIVDARSADRFRGENESLDPVAGHIPGAVNRWFKDNLTITGHFKPAAQLRKEIQSLLINDQPIVVHQCGSGVSACHNLLAMEIAGLPAGVLYPGSWSEWCADASRPVECG